MAALLTLVVSIKILPLLVSFCIYLLNQSVLHEGLSVVLLNSISVKFIRGYQSAKPHRKPTVVGVVVLLLEGLVKQLWSCPDGQLT